MEQSRILLIGQDGPFRTSLLGKLPNLAEFGAVIWYPGSIHTEWSDHGARTTIDSLSKLINWTKKGNALVIIGAPPEDPTTTYSQNNATYRVNILKNEIFAGLNFRPTTGFLVEFIGPKPLENVFSSLASSLCYHAILESKETTPLFRVSTALQEANQIVGAYKKLGNGIVVFMPPQASINSKTLQSYHYHVHVASILEAVREPDTEERPAWLDSFQSVEELRLGERLVEAEKRIEEIQTQIAELQRNLQTERSNKDLFTATGDRFATIVGRP